MGLVVALVRWDGGENLLGDGLLGLETRQQEMQEEFGLVGFA